MDIRFTFKILAFTALLLISKLTKEDKLVTTPAIQPQAIANADSTSEQLPILTTGNLQQEKRSSVPVQILVATDATIKGRD